MLPAMCEQVDSARGVEGERRWAWRWPLAGRTYGCSLAGVFGLPTA